MNGHLDWNQLDAYARGLLDGPAEVHLAECGDCAGRLAALREEEEALRKALKPDDDGDEVMEEAIVHSMDGRRPGPPRRRAGLLPLLAAGAMVAALILVLHRPSSDPMAEALASGDRAEILRYGRKAAAHAPADLAAQLRRSLPRVLYVEGESRGEYRMLRPALLKDAGLLVHTMLLSSTDADLYGKSEPADAAPSRFRGIATMFPLSDADLIDYDVVIIGEVEAQRLASSPDVLAAAMKSFVTRLGGTLILIAGPKSSPADAHHAVDELLPVDLGRASCVSTEVTTRSGAALRWHVAAPLRAGSRALLETEGGTPITSSWPAGRGRVVFVASDDFWKWGPERQYAVYRPLIAE